MNKITKYAVATSLLVLAGESLYSHLGGSGPGVAEISNYLFQGGAGGLALSGLTALVNNIDGLLD